MPSLKIFIVEDEEILRVTLADDLREAGYFVQDFADPLHALAAVENQPVDVIITDIKMPQMDGLELLHRIKSIRPGAFVIVMTAYSSVDSAVEAMKKGAYDYISKPFKIDEILLLLDRIAELDAVKRENRRLQNEVASRYPLEAFVGSSLATIQTLEMVTTVANSSTTVLITGETGTGKELIANILHYNSNRRNKAFIKVGCAILARDVFESELFGHEKGAFTGATKARAGRFEMADGGSLYLDDVDDIPPELQVKLLRVLQEQEFERVGGNQTIKVDVRVIASTKADLNQMVKEGKFRQDLYYRLNVFPIHIPPLRERPEDIVELVDHFGKEFCSNCKLNIPPTIMEKLQRYSWPGNVRELRNIIERLVLLTKCSSYDISKIPPEIYQPHNEIPLISVGEKSLPTILRDVEISLIKHALQSVGGQQVLAAKLLGIPPSTLRTKMMKYDLISKND